MHIRVSTSVDLHDVEVEVEVDEEQILEALEGHDDPIRFLPHIYRDAEATFEYFRAMPPREIPECVRQLIWHSIGRIL